LKPCRDTVRSPTETLPYRSACRIYAAEPVARSSYRLDVSTSRPCVRKLGRWRAVGGSRNRRNRGQPRCVSLELPDKSTALDSARLYRTERARRIRWTPEASNRHLLPVVGYAQEKTPALSVSRCIERRVVIDEELAWKQIHPSYRRNCICRVTFAYPRRCLPLP